MEKIDHKKILKDLYKPSNKKVVMVDVPKMNFIMIDGKGDPNTSREFQEAVEALFSFSYALKFMIKKGDLGIDYSVMPLEGLWWADTMTDFINGNRDSWKWTLMIMQPEFVDRPLFEQASEQVKAKKKLDALPKLRFDSLNEGRCAQILYIGSYAEEGPIIEMIHHFIEIEGFKLRGKHHEIYLSDFRRTAPEKLKTILRQPLV